jgi:hypothetical protein
MNDLECGSHAAAFGERACARRSRRSTAATHSESFEPRDEASYRAGPPGLKPPATERHRLKPG